MITEPIQGEGGDNHAPASWFINLQKICKKYDVALIIDEVFIIRYCRGQISLL
jgi:4-aminobutyrate aminotransferase-like enzyme